MQSPGKVSGGTGSPRCASRTAAIFAAGRPAAGPALLMSLLAVFFVLQSMQRCSSFSRRCASLQRADRDRTHRPGLPDTAEDPAPTGA